MLHILGMILKGIGITLLCILLLLLFLLLAILFVPVRYRIAADKPEEGNARAKVKAGWLFSIVTVFAEWEGKLHYGVKIFGFSVYDNLKKSVAKKEKTKTIKKKKKKKPKKEKKKKEKQEKQEKQNREALPKAEKERKQKTQTAADSPAVSEIRAVSRTANSFFMGISSFKIYFLTKSIRT